MNIEFTVEDYFKELQLMEAQYGQKRNYILGFTCYCRWLSQKKFNPERNMHLSL